MQPRLIAACFLVCFCLQGATSLEKEQATQIGVLSAQVRIAQAKVDAITAKLTSSNSANAKVVADLTAAKRQTDTLAALQSTQLQTLNLQVDSLRQQVIKLSSTAAKSSAEATAGKMQNQRLAEDKKVLKQAASEQAQASAEQHAGDTASASAANARTNERIDAGARAATKKQDAVDENLTLLTTEFEKWAYRFVVLLLVFQGATMLLIYFARFRWEKKI